jgi:hypothetical protein
MSSVVEMIREHIRAVNSIQTCTLIVSSIILLEVSSFCGFFVTDTIAHRKSLTSRSAQFIRSRFPRESPLGAKSTAVCSTAFEINLVSNSACVSGVVLHVSVAKRWDNAGTFQPQLRLPTEKVLGSQPGWGRHVVLGNNVLVGSVCVDLVDVEKYSLA